MATILNSAMLDSDTAILDSETLFSSLRFTPKHSHSTLALTQTNSIWLKLSHLSFSSQTISHLPRLVPNICTKKLHSFILWLNLMIAAILKSAILNSAILHTKKLHSFILTQLDDGSHLELCQHGFNHFAKKELHSFILTQLDDGIYLEFCHLDFCHLWFSYFAQNSDSN